MENKEIIQLIEKKINSVKHGAINLTLYNGIITKIETNEKISFSEKGQNTK